MKPSIGLVATAPFTHEHRSIAQGEYFTASPIAAAALVYQRKAKFATIECTSRQREDVSTEPPAEAPRRRRRYRRRDMVAEHSENA
jgi:hypothetical protein